MSWPVALQGAVKYYERNTMINPAQLKTYIVVPELKRLGLHSEDAVALVMGTAAQESRMGEYLKQIGDGPARGIFQMERATEKDIWDNYLKYKPELIKLVRAITVNQLPYYSDEILYNLRYATAMCRIHYLRVKEKLPHHKDVAAQARYWKVYYNTHLGRGVEEDFIENYKLYAE